LLSADRRRRGRSVPCSTCRLYSRSRAGYFPNVLSITHGRRQTSHVALLAGDGAVTGAVIGYVLALIVEYSGSGSVGAALLTMAVFGAVISSLRQMISLCSCAPEQA